MGGEVEVDVELVVLGFALLLLLLLVGPLLVGFTDDTLAVKVVGA